MKTILSIDIGIKNLACCVIHVDESLNEIKILKWDVLNLIPDAVCQKCGKKAKLQKNEIKVCRRHAKEYPPFHILSPSLEKVHTKSLRELREELLGQVAFITWLSKSHIAAQDEIKTAKKKDLITYLKHYKEEQTFDDIKVNSASSHSFMTLGRSIMNCFDKWLDGIIVDNVLIENQISPLANRMKTIQGMVTQYMIMRDVPQVEYISALNKLKVAKYIPHLPPLPQKTYSQRKKSGIELTSILISNETISSCTIHHNFLKHFRNHTKKDDLADAFLQGVWWILQIMRS
jgi:hypothetical protein